MNRRQKESIAKYCYNMSQAIHVGWMIGVATGRVSWFGTLILVGVGIDFLIIAYKQEEDING